MQSPDVSFLHVALHYSFLLILLVSSILQCSLLLILLVFLPSLHYSFLLILLVSSIITVQSPADSARFSSIITVQSPAVSCVASFSITVQSRAVSPRFSFVRSFYQLYQHSFNCLHCFCLGFSRFDDECTVVERHVNLLLRSVPAIAHVLYPRLHRLSAVLVIASVRHLSNPILNPSLALLFRSFRPFCSSFLLIAWQQRHRGFTVLVQWFLFWFCSCLFLFHFSFFTGGNLFTANAAVTQL